LDVGTIALAGANAYLIDCYSGVPGASTPILDFGGTGTAVAVRNYNGGMTLKNKTGTDACSIDINSGQIIVDSTVSNGTLILRGFAKLTDNSTPPAIVDSTYLLDASMMVELHALAGLKAGTPLQVTQTARTAGSISQSISEAGGTVTVTRT
jgi:hypothetical protein